jgi:uncharacterized protein YkwD
MPIGGPVARIASALLFISLIAACSDGSDRSSTGTSATQLAAQESTAPATNGDVADDGLAWINYRRVQAGLRPVARDARLDRAAAAHAAYQQLNNLITHDERPALRGFSGAAASDRLRAAGYPLDSDARADGEVIAATAEADGFAAAEGLLGAIYHRYLMLEPRFDLAGAGTAHRAGGYDWLNVNFVATRASAGLSAGQIVVWPVPGQQSVRTRVFSDQETPDPVPGRDAVGYPASVHASLGALLQVNRFTLRERGGNALQVVLLDGETDRDTPTSAAAIIPLVRLRAGTVHDVEFIGSVDNQPVERRWSFTTR